MAEYISYPIDLVILKVAQLCNINCAYCYVYNKGDESWKQRPHLITEEVAKKVGASLNENAILHNHRKKCVELHGGEPLLLGKRRFLKVVQALVSACPDVQLQLYLQTNGILLDEEWVEIFATNRIQFGISLDGPASVNDAYRVTKRGNGTHKSVVSGIDRAKKHAQYDKLFTGYLCVVNETADGKELINWFKDFGAKSLDLLLPDGTFSDKFPTDQLYSVLVSAFSEYIANYDGSIRIRIFDEIMKSKLGKPSSLDTFGSTLKNMCVVESDGELYAHDVLRITGIHKHYPKLNIDSHPIGISYDYYDLEQIEKLSNKCISCEHLDSCGGGYLPHRYDGTNFSNPSAHCSTLFQLSTMAQNHIKNNAFRSDV